MARIVISGVFMRRIAHFVVALAVAFVLIAPAARAQNDAQTAQALVGRWEWQDTMNGAAVYHQLTLAGGGNYTYTSAMQSYQVTSWGAWAFQGGWLMFKTTGSSSLDPAGRPIGLGPIQILEVGPDYVRTPAGTAHRTL
jgi:hypothetical protein